jgi:hypothetical protein
VNATTHGGRTGGNHGGRGGDGSYHGGHRGERSGDGGRGGFGHDYGGCGEQKPSSNRQCQLCGKEGHIVLRCWKRFDHNYHGEEKSTNATDNPYGIDTMWYADSTATDHVTGELDKLTTREKYHVQEHIHTTDGTGMHIAHIGNSTIQTPSRDIHLKKVLHVPHTSKNLVSIHRLTYDNNVSVEFHPFSFLIKDRATRRIILRGRCQGGLYPLPSLKHLSSRCVLSVNKPPVSRWHGRLGHPSYAIVHKVLSTNNLDFVSEASQGVYNACQQAKSHQFPFPKSVSVSKAQLELIFSDVWGPAPNSMGRKNYYVSFIDDYSKFTWIYLLKHKSEVFEKFHLFQQHVERMLSRKILSIQTDWEANIRS